ncbi:MAG: hypothetical protein LBU19_08205 [Treponema sp.]|nr:hypothetical protein [Treponema sp.]
MPAPDIPHLLLGDRGKVPAHKTVDVYEKDGLASTALIALSKEQCLERDRLIFSFLRARGLPSAWLMAGGYGEDAWEPTANFLVSLASDWCC